MPNVFDEFPVPAGLHGQLERHLHQPEHSDGASVVTVTAQPGSLKILVAINSAFILLDVQDTLRDLGYNSVHGTCSAVQARANCVISVAMSSFLVSTPPVPNSNFY